MGHSFESAALSICVIGTRKCACRRHQPNKSVGTTRFIDSGHCTHIQQLLNLASSHLPCQIKFNFTLVAHSKALNAATTQVGVSFQKSTQLAARTNSYLRNSQESSRIGQTSLHVLHDPRKKGAPCVQGFWNLSKTGHGSRCLSSN